MDSNKELIKREMEREDNNKTISKSQIFIYILGGIIIIIFSEMSVNYVGKNLTNTITFYILPLVLCLFAYLALRNKLIYRKK